LLPRHVSVYKHHKLPWRGVDESLAGGCDIWFYARPKVSRESTGKGFPIGLGFLDLAALPASLPAAFCKSTRLQGELATCEGQEKVQEYV
jgi:hypothetical protein